MLLTQMLTHRNENNQQQGMHSDTVSKPMVNIIEPLQ